MFIYLEERSSLLHLLKLLLGVYFRICFLGSSAWLCDISFITLKDLLFIFCCCEQHSEEWEVAYSLIPQMAAASKIWASLEAGSRNTLSRKPDQKQSNRDSTATHGILTSQAAA